MLLYLPYFIFPQALESKLFLTKEIRIRDPYIYADSTTESYYMYAQIDNRLDGKDGDKRPKGVEMYVSSDLKNWEHPQAVMLLGDDFFGKRNGVGT